jgi:hypothetical protein
MVTAKSSRQQPAAPELDHVFDIYQDVRGRTLRMRELMGAERAVVDHPSPYWQARLTAASQLLDATPEVVAELRRHCHRVGPAHPADYEPDSTVARGGLDRRQFIKKLRALVEVGGTELVVPESPALGGFGFEVDGALYNLDTLKGIEALIALERGAILGDFRCGGERRVVWEIGAGWGGLAYQFKTLFPNVTYIISDFPEVLLLSAVYLKAVFPRAHIRFYGDVPDRDLLRDWQEADFVLVPNARIDVIQPERLDLAVSVTSFEGMTDEQMATYSRRAFEAGCRYFYSLNRETRASTGESTGVRNAIARYYWPHEMPVLPVDFDQMLDEGPRVPLKKIGQWPMRKTGNPAYRHVNGWRRIVV